MAKLDKAQQLYAMRRIDTLAGEASRENVNGQRAQRVAENAAIKAALEAKGFVVVYSHNISEYVQLKPTAAALAKKAAEKAREQTVKDMAQAAKDTIMLGDVGEVTEVLAKLAKDLAKLKG